MLSIPDLQARVDKVKTELTRTLLESDTTNGTEGQMAAFAALAETTAEYGVLFMGREMTADILKELRLIVIKGAHKRIQG
jgi:hypothetical protein